MVIEPPQEWGVHLPGSYLVFSTKQECANTTHKHTIPWYFSWKAIIIVRIRCIKFTKDETKKHFKRSNRVLRKRFSPTLSTHSSPQKRMSFLEWPMHVSPGRKPNPHQYGPPTDNSYRRRRKKEEDDPHLHIDKKPQEQKLEQLCSARLIHHNSKAVKLHKQRLKK
jgi:hypothetical protein